MKFILMGLMLIVSACAHPARPALSEEQVLQAEGYSILTRCQILNLQGVPIRQLNGGRCVYFDDGSYMSGDSMMLTFYNKENQIVWRKVMHTHHILTQMSGDRVLVGTSEVHKMYGKVFRFDILLMIDKSGTELARFSFFEHHDEIMKLLKAGSDPPYYDFNWDPGSTLKAKFELTHMNSYYEIPPYSGPRVEGFAPGDILINSPQPRDFILVLDSKLKAIKFFRKMAPTNHVAMPAHDVQMVRNGHLIAYVNRDSTDPSLYSTLREIDPVSWKTIWKFVDTPVSHFYSETQGGLQALPNGDIFFSDITGDVARVRIVDRSFREKLNVPLQLGAFSGLQDAKLQNVSKFLSNNVAL